MSPNLPATYKANQLRSNAQSHGRFRAAETTVTYELNLLSGELGPAVSVTLGDPSLVHAVRPIFSMCTQKEVGRLVAPGHVASVAHELVGSERNRVGPHVGETVYFQYLSKHPDVAVTLSVDGACPDNAGVLK